MAVGILIAYALVAQPDRVFGYEPKGRGFESLPARQTRKTPIGGVFFVLVTTKRWEGLET